MLLVLCLGWFPPLVVIRLPLMATTYHKHGTAPAGSVALLAAPPAAAPAAQQGPLCPAPPKEPCSR